MKVGQEKNIVLVVQPGKYKMDNGFKCLDEYEANNLARYLKHLQVKGEIIVISEDTFLEYPEQFD